MLTCNIQSDIQFTLAHHNMQYSYALLCTGDGLHISADDPVQQQHHFPFLPFQWNAQHPLRRSLCSNLLCCLPGWGDCGWTLGEANRQDQHLDHDPDILDCNWHRAFSCLWRQEGH